MIAIFEPKYWTNKARWAYNATINSKEKGEQMKQDTLYTEGQQVEFTGYTGSDLPDDSELLIEGEVYEILLATPSDAENEEFYTLKVDNPDFDPDKRKTKNNKEHTGVDVYVDEFVTIELEEEEPEVEEDEIEEEIVVEKPAPKAKKKAAPKAAPKSKAKPAPKAKAKTKATPKAKAKAKVKPVTEAITKTTKTTKKAPTSTSKLKEVSEEVDTENQDMIVLDESEENAEVLEMVNGTDDICELAKEMRQESANMDYMMGGVLYHVRLSKAYKELDDRYKQNKGFALYVDECLGIRYRSAMNYISVYTTFSRLGVDVEVYSRLGPTRCTEIARVADKDNIDDLIKLAEESTVIEIKDAIKESYVAGSDGTLKKIKRVTFKFALHEDQGATVRTLFEEAKQALGLENDEDVFESIVTEWALEHLNVKPKAKGKTKARAKTKKQVEEEVEEVA